MKLLNAVVDSLDLRISSTRIKPTRWLSDQFPLWRDIIQNWQPGQEPHIIHLDGVGEFVLFGGARPYEFNLVNRQICDIRIWNPDKWLGARDGQTGQIFISYRSKYLQHFGLDGVRSMTERIQRLFIPGPVQRGTGWDWWRVARADLAVDLQLKNDLLFADLDGLVCVTRKRDVWNSTLSGVLPKDLLNNVLRGKILGLPQVGNKGGDVRADASVGITDGGLEEGTSSSAPRGQKGKKSEPWRILHGQLPVGTLRAFCEAMLQEWETQNSAYMSRVVTSGVKPRTVYLGRFQSPLYARIYDKCSTLIVQNKLYMQDIWIANGWDLVSPVWRFEFSLSGDFLKQCAGGPNGTVDWREFDDFLDNRGSIWAYLTTRWLSWRIPDRSRSHAEKWDIRPEWELVKSAWEHSEDLIRVKPDFRNNPEALKKQAAGVLVTIAACRAASSLDDRETESFDILRGIREFAGEMLETWVYDKEFIKLVHKRAKKLGLDRPTDTELTAMVRAQRMQEGYGS